MGKIQCVSLRNGSDIWNLIEKGLNNKNSTLEKKIFEEYTKLKKCLINNKTPKTSSKQNQYESPKDIKNMSGIKSKIAYNNQHNLINEDINNYSNAIRIKTRMGRFIKWYRMAAKNNTTNTTNSNNNLIKSNTT